MCESNDNYRPWLLFGQVDQPKMQQTIRKYYCHSEKLFISKTEIFYLIMQAGKALNRLEMIRFLAFWLETFKTENWKQNNQLVTDPCLKFELSQLKRGKLRLQNKDRCKFSREKKLGQTRIGLRKHAVKLGLFAHFFNYKENMRWICHFCLDIAWTIWEDNLRT